MDSSNGTGIIEVSNLNFYYGQFKALIDVSIKIQKNEITALIGPSGCGKSTFLRCLNRMNDTIPGTSIEGSVIIDGADIYAGETDLAELRQKVGMVFQKPNPFPQSIFDNVAFGPRVLGLYESRDQLQEIVIEALDAVGLLDDFENSWDESALNLSLGEQQRLCLARVLAVRPEIILMDEPCSALDPIATLQIEQLMQKLKESYTIVIVTHNMQQAARVSVRTGLFWLGELIEFDQTSKIFTRPSEQKTEDYVSGRTG